MSFPKIVLRYFPVCGRAQALRHALTEASVPFEDVRIPVSDWPNRRLDPQFAGTYRALPTLSWGDTLVSETLPIASFVARRLGQYDGVGDEGIARREAMVSTCFLDVMLRLVEIIRSDTTFPGSDLAQCARNVLPRVMTKLELVDAQIPEGSFAFGAKPLVADFFAAESFEALRYTLGPIRDGALRMRFPRLSTITLRIRERAELARAHEMRPARFTARPDEDALLARLQAVDLSAIGL